MSILEAGNSARGGGGYISRHQGPALVRVCQVVWHWIQAAARVSHIQASACKCMQSHMSINSAVSTSRELCDRLLHHQATIAVSRCNIRA